MLRANEPELGLWLLKTAGDAGALLRCDSLLEKLGDDWLAREIIGLLRRTFARLDVSSRSMYAIIDSGSCFVGTLLELALAADRSYMLSVPDEEAADKNVVPSGAPKIALSEMNFGAYPSLNDHSRLAVRFRNDESKLAELRKAAGRELPAEEARGLGLVT